MSNNITVLKRDNSKEEFDENKIVKISIAAGLDEDEATTVSNTVVAKVKELASDSNNEILSTKIRDIFLTELQAANKYAAGLYEWYEKSKST